MISHACILFISIANLLQLISPSASASSPSLCCNRAITLRNGPPTPTLDSAATDAVCLDINSKQRGGPMGERQGGGIPLGPSKQTPLSGNWSANKHLDRCFKTQRTKSTFVQAHKWAGRRLRVSRTCTLAWRTLGEMIVIKAGVPLRFPSKNMPQDKTAWSSSPCSASAPL